MGCDVKATSKRNCLSCLKPIERAIANLDLSKISTEIANTKVRDLFKNNGANVIKYGDKTLIEVINELKTKIDTKQNQHCNLDYISTFTLAEIQKIKTV